MDITWGTIMPQTISLVLSLAALALSAVTAWLTFFRRGAVRMTQPTVCYFGAANPQPGPESPPPKIYLRTLLYCTAKRGRIVENMFLRLRHGETDETFNIWVLEHGVPLPGPISRGSGLFVGEDGVLGDHYFLLPYQSTYSFQPGEYTLDVYASLVGDRDPTRLFTIHLTLSPDEAKQLQRSEMGVFFDWQPDARRYRAHLHRGPQIRLPPLFLDRQEATAGDEYNSSPSARLSADPPSEGR
jgi:hypothetical protein